MLFNGNKYRSRIEELEAELATFYDTEQDLRKEMIYFSLDDAGNFIEVSQRFTESLGYSHKDISNKNIKDILIDRSLKKEHTSQMLHAIKNKKHWHGALQLTCKNTTEVWFRAIVQPKRQKNTGHTEFSVYATELTRTISKSKKDDDMLSALNRSAAVIEFNLDGIILGANENFLRSVNYKKSDIIGKHHSIFCEQSEVDSPAYAEFWRTLAAGNFVSDRFKRIDSYGNDVWLEASYNPVRDDDGVLYKVMKFATVITEQMHREFAISETSQIAYDISKDTDASAASGIEVINNTIRTMSELSEQMEHASKGIYELDEQSSKVSDLVESIRGIAEQTNLLALNAAIEAARAGEQGRGFAVVADEVRQLASRTSAATEQIIAVVSKNKQLTGGAVSLIEQSQLKANSALELSNEAGKVMNDIQVGAQQVVDAVSNFNKNL